MWPWQVTQAKSYLVVGVGLSCSLTLHKNTTDDVSKKPKRCSEVVTLQSYWEGLIYYLHSHWLCSTKDNSMSSCFMKEVFISCVQNRKRSTRLHRSNNSLCVLADTSIVSVLVSKGTHSRASSAQQPPHRLKETQDGTKRLCVSPGSSRHTSTRVSRGSHPLREYTSSHRLTGEDTSLSIGSLIHQPHHFIRVRTGDKNEPYLLGLPWISESLLAASERA